MSSTNRTTIAGRISQCLAATALISGLTIGTAAIAGAESNQDQYNRCIINGGYIDECCIKAQGDPIIDAEDGYVVGCWYFADGSGLDNAPQEPGQTTPPPVLDPGQTGPSNPLIPTPRGPNSGTLAP